jgi:hypothetical protein
VIKMNVKKKYLIPILLVCLMAGQIMSIYADNYTPHLQVTTTNTTLAAGSKSNININLYNSGDYDVTEIEALLSSTTPGVSIINGSQKVINLIERNKSADYEVLIMVDQNVVIGAYPLTMTLSYLRTGRGIVTVTIPLSIVVEKPSLPAIKITSSDNKLTPGVESVVTLTVENMAISSVTNVDITLSSASPLFTLTSQINYNITELKQGGSVSFNVKVKSLENTPIGAYVLTAQVWYTNDSDVENRQTVSVPLEVTTSAVTKSPVITITNLNPRTVVPGETFSIDLQAECSDASISNAKAVLTTDVKGLILPMNPTTVSLGDLAVGKLTKFSYALLLSGSATAVDIPLTVSIKYVDSKGIQGVAIETITVPVENLVHFSLMQDQGIIAERGSTQTLEADLLLVGTGRVEFTQLQVLPESPVIQVTGSTEYIGAIDPDSPVPFTLKFAVSNSSVTGDYSLKLRITYLNSKNIQQNATISVPLSVTPNTTVVNPPASDGGIWGWIKRLFGIQ